MLIRSHLASPPVNHTHDLLQGVLVLLQQIGDHGCDASADSCHAVHQNIGGFSAFLDEVVCLAEMLAQVVALVILGGNVEVVGDVFLFVFEETAPGDGEDGLDALG